MKMREEKFHKIRIKWCKEKDVQSKTNKQKVRGVFALRRYNEMTQGLTSWCKEGRGCHSKNDTVM